MTLVFLDGKLGDSIVNSALIDGIRRAYPRLPIWVLSLEATASYWRSHPDVERVIVVPSNPRKNINRFELYLLGRRLRGQVGAAVAFEMMANLEVFLILSAMRPQLTIGFLKQEYRLFDVSLLEYGYGLEKKSVGFRIENLLRLFQVETPYSRLRRHVPVSPNALREVPNCDLIREGQPLLFLNAYGEARCRTFTPESLDRLIDTILSCLPGYQVVLNLSEEQACDHEVEAIVRNKHGRILPLPRRPELDALFAAISMSHMVITPDSGPAHVAAALDKPVLTFFADRVHNPIVWKPICNCSESILSQDGVDINNQDWPKSLERVRCFLSLYREDSPQESILPTTTEVSPA